MPMVTEVERAAMDGGPLSTTGRLIGAFYALWLPTLLVVGVLWMTSGPMTLFGTSDGAEAGTQNPMPVGDMTAVLVMPTVGLVQLGVLWWGWKVLMEEYQKRHGRHRRRRRKFTDRLIQRLALVCVALSMLAAPPFVVWLMIYRLFPACIRI
ncbi:MAG: hypothetical protein FJ388_09465 [Verrucomicrobia bacterium]|nr:hypothetical protein [Verrucomicrobiota bacterium]